MKRFGLILICNLIALITSGQEIEICSSLNTSTEQRFQNALGFGIQYQQKLNRNFKAGLGFQYIVNSAQFDQIVHGDVPGTYSFNQIDSKSKRFSMRLNIQWIVKENDNISLSIGPEAGYNFMWGKEVSKSYYGNNNILSDLSIQSYNNDVIHAFSLGINSTIEIKNIIYRQLSLCFNIRPEEIIKFNNKTLVGQGDYIKPYTANIGFCEFQIGLKYRINQ